MRGQPIRAGRPLDCGCCGRYFRTWKGYTDMDQDNGYGICKPCQGLNAEHEDRLKDKLIEALRSGLNETNRATLDAMDRDLQYAFAAKALDEGLLKWEIRASPSERIA